MRRFLPLLLLVLTLCGCDKAEDLYAHTAARLTYNYVNTTPQLLNALNGAGQWCIISYDAASASSYSYTFTDANGSSFTSQPLQTVLNGTPISVAGFIVGTPSIVDMNGRLYPQAFDRVCPNCYEETYIQRRLNFHDQTGHVHCSTCHRVYDLNNGGIITAGENGKKLYRYHVSYAGNNVAITN